MSEDYEKRCKDMEAIERTMDLMNATARRNKNTMICEVCKGNKNVRYREDPYAAEIYGDVIILKMCGKCFEDSCDEI
jgi:hypothetical protein